MKISDNVKIIGIKYVNASLYFLDSSVSIYRDTANNLVFDDAFNTPQTLSQIVSEVNSIKPNILDWSTNKYIPYATKLAVGTSAYFYSEVVWPDGTKFLGLNGVLAATGILSSTVLNANNYEDINDSGTELLLLSKLGPRSISQSGNIVTIKDLTSVTGDSSGVIISVIDYPSVSGTKTSVLFNAMFDSSVSRFKMWPRVPNTTNAVAYMFDTVNDLSIYGAKLLSIKNAGIEKLYIDISGNVYTNGILLGTGNVSKAYVDGSLNLKVNKAGDTMSGDLTINASAFINGLLRANTFEPTNYADGNTFFGYLSGNASSQLYNTGFGFQSLSQNQGFNNTAFGMNAAVANTTGISNVAVGTSSLEANLIGTGNVAIGANALQKCTSEGENTAVGDLALFDLLAGHDNVAIGSYAGKFNFNYSATKYALNSIFIGSNTRGKTDAENINEIVIGYNAVGLGKNTIVLGNTDVSITLLMGNVGINQPVPTYTLDVSGNFHTTGAAQIDGSLFVNGNIQAYSNIILGKNGTNMITYDTVYHNVLIGTVGAALTSGPDNVLMGNQSGRSITTAAHNFALGSYAFSEGTGSNNVAIGGEALRKTTGNYNVALGSYAGSLISGKSGGNIFIGFEAGKGANALGNFNILIGYGTEAPNLTGSNQLNLGNVIYGTGLGIVGSISSSTGKVGIDINAPAYTLDVSGNFHTTGAAQIDGSLHIPAIPGYDSLTVGTDSSTLIKIGLNGEAGSAIFYQVYSNALWVSSFGPRSNAAPFYWTDWNGNKLLTCLTSSTLPKFGVGTTPSYTLDVAGDFHTTGAAKIDGSINLLNNAITGVLTPVNSSDAVNKYYADSINSSVNTALVANASTSTEIRFDRALGYIYGTTTIPLTGAITMSASSAIVGVVDLLIHGPDTSTDFSKPVTFKHLTGIYNGSVNNFIFIEYLDASTQIYTINQVS